MSDATAIKKPLRMPTGIPGFDQVTDGGLPRRGVTVVHGGAGAGKTIFGMQVLASGLLSREPGIVVAFEESAGRLLENTAGFAWGGEGLVRRGITLIDAQLSESVEQGGEFDLIGLLAVVDAKANEVGAKRVVFDGIDMLLGHLTDRAHVRREVFRLREWVHASALSAILTAKTVRSDEYVGSEYQFLQFMADCVVTLHHRLSQGTALRFLRVAKYRGAAHSSNEFPITITPSGIEVAATMMTEVAYPASTERITTGVARLDAMLSGGYYRGSSILVTGSPGTAKTSLAAAFAAASAARGERTLYVSFDEAPEQIVRNVASIGIHFGPPVQSGTLSIHSLRGRAENPEAHVARLRALVRVFQPRNIVIDPLSALEQRGCEADAEVAALQVMDLAKSAGITIVNTSLLGTSLPLVEQTPLAISTIADTWLHVAYTSQGGERNRTLTIVKARGTGHSNQVRELILNDDGITLADVYSVGGEVLMGTLRWEKENAEKRNRAEAERQASLRTKRAELALAEIDAQLDTLARGRAIQEAELLQIRASAAADLVLHTVETEQLLNRRRADGDITVPPAPIMWPEHEE